MSTNQENIVKLKVGGTLYETSLSTIRNFPNSMLATAVSDRWNEGDNSGEPIVSFDRDGQRFKHVLDYLRDGKVNLPIGETKAIFITELEYFGIDIHPDSITSDEDVTLISFQQRFESHLSRVEGTMKTHQKVYVGHKIGLDVYKEAVVQNAKQCTSGDSRFEFEIVYDENDKTVCEVLNENNFEDTAAENTFFDAINTVVKDMNVAVTAINKYNGHKGRVCYGIKVGKRVEKRSREEVTSCYFYEFLKEVEN